MKSLKPIISCLLIASMLLAVACNESSSRHRKHKDDNNGILEFLTVPTTETWHEMPETSEATEPSETTATTETSEASISENDKEIIRVWSYTDEAPAYIQNYVDSLPDFSSEYELEVTIKPTTAGTYQAALDSAFASGENAPDIYFVESTFLAKYTQGEFASTASTYADLGIDVDAKIEEAAIAPFIVTAGTRSSDNQVVALAFQSDPDFFIYRRSYAINAFGNDDPEFINTTIGGGSGSWEAFFDACGVLKQHGYAMVSGNQDIMNSCFGQAATPWVIDGEVNIDPAREQYFDFAYEMTSNGWNNQNRMWSSEWFDELNDRNSNVFAYIGPSWFINYTLMLGDDEYINTNPAYGDWGVCLPPVVSFKGGSWVFANSNSSDEVKPAVAQIIEWMTLDCSETGLQYLRASRTEFANTEVVASNTVLANCDGSMAGLGGQNLYAMAIVANTLVRGDNLSEYDEDITLIWGDAAEIYVAGDVSRSEALINFAEAAQYYADITYG